MGKWPPSWMTAYRSLKIPKYMPWSAYSCPTPTLLKLPQWQWITLPVQGIQTASISRLEGVGRQGGGVTAQAGGGQVTPGRKRRQRQVGEGRRSPGLPRSCRHQLWEFWQLTQPLWIWDSHLENEEVGHCYQLKCIPLESWGEATLPRTSECNHIWRWGYSKSWLSSHEVRRVGP